MSNYFKWDAREQAEFLIDNFDFETSQGMERTFNLYAKLDDIHANGLHDYLKYLKFGYGRATDDASNEIRHGRITREEGIKLVEKYDHIRPSDLDLFLKEHSMTEDEFLSIIEPMRDPSIWEKNKKGQWVRRDSIINHINDDGVDYVRLPISNTNKPFIKTNEKKSTHSIRHGEEQKYVLL